MVNVNFVGSRVILNAEVIILPDAKAILYIKMQLFFCELYKAFLERARTLLQVDMLRA